MRNLFLALVLANLAFAAWHAWVAVPAEPAARVMGADVPSIALAGERSPLTAEAGTPTAEAGTPTAEAGMPAADAASAGGCVSVGPFMELAQAAAAAGALRGHGLEPAQRIAEGDIRVGYWVYLGGIGTQAEGNEILATLRENGMDDPYLIADTDGSHVISLGIYTEVARAGRRRDAVSALGHDVMVVDRNRRGTVYWVDVPLEAGGALDLEMLQPPGRIMRLEQRACAREPFEPLPPLADEVTDADEAADANEAEEQ